MHLVSSDGRDRRICLDAHLGAIAGWLQFLRRLSGDLSHEIDRINRADDAVVGQGVAIGSPVGTMEASASLDDAHASETSKVGSRVNLWLCSVTCRMKGALALS